jgi:hypothetical protein
MGKVFSFYGSTMSHPWTKHILSFFRQDLGFNMTLGSCSRNIELLCVITLNCTIHAYLASGHLTYYFFQANTKQLFLKTLFLNMYAPCTTTSHVCMLAAPLLLMYVC